VIGRYPDVYSAAVLRNPVISCGEISTSDIADWYFIEFGFPYPMKSPPSSVPPETYKSLYLASPVAHIDNITAKVLLLVGLQDQRVAPTQGINYYHDLKAKGKDVDMLVFPDADHSLDGVEVARVSWQASLELFTRN
jgi:pimeloyl-ACP methyl ester carboxylesterase